MVVSYSVSHYDCTNKLQSNLIGINERTGSNHVTSICTAVVDLLKTQLTTGGAKV